MGLTTKEKHSEIRVTAPRYQEASKKQKGIMLSEFIALSSAPQSR